MMIQSAPEGEARFVCSMRAHMALCEQFVRAFGNDDFAPPEPYDEVVYAVAHHDRGWDDFDAAPVLDADSGLPCGIGGAPVPGSLETSRRSPDFNQRRHAYCGLLSSMHSWGLYNGRYGFTAFRVRPGGSTSIPIPPQHAAEGRAMLDGELARQERLRAQLAADPATAPWVEERRLMANYKLLQFCDTLALYFNLRHEDARGEEVYVHVPRSADEDAEVSLRPQGGGVYALSPFPFAGTALQAVCRGRWFAPVRGGAAPADLAAALDALPESTQTYTLVAG